MKNRITVLEEKFRSLTPSTKARLVLAVIDGVLAIWLLTARAWEIAVPRGRVEALPIRRDLFLIAILINFLAVILLP